MEPGVIIGLAVFLITIVMGISIAWCFILSTTVTLVLLDSSLLFMVNTGYHAIENYILMAIAFFILAGNLLSTSGLAECFIRFSNSLVGRVRGGLVDVGIITITFLGALTGSSVPTIAATIPIIVPQLEKYGYDRAYVTSALCSASYLGYLIPPSVPGLLYCLVAGQSVAALFLATIFPGLILSTLLMIVNTFLHKRYYKPTKEVPPLPVGIKASFKEVFVSGRSAAPALLIPISVLGGIYGGVFTPNEAGVVGCLMTLIVAGFVYRQMKGKDIVNGFKEAINTMGMLTLLTAFSTVFTRLMVREGVAQALADTMLGAFQSKIMILMMVNVFLLIAGMFIDGVPIMLVVVPLLLPLAQATGVNLVHLGAIVVVNVGIGVTTPPYAVSMFVGSKMANVPYESLVKPMLLFLLFAGIPTLLLTTYVPAISTWLPTVVLGANIVGPW